MKTFIVQEKFTGYNDITIYADPEEEARELARANINSFPVDNEFTGEWVIESIEEV